MTSPAAPGVGRLQGVDFARSAAILVAMFSHSLVASGVRDFGSPAQLMPILFVIHFAAPTFIALFGAMLEIAYLTRIRTGQGGAAVNRLMTRALQCYLLYALCAIVVFAIGHATIEQTLRRVTLFGYIPFVGILQFYVYMLLLAPLLLVARNRYGLAPLLIVAALIQLAYPLFRAIPEIPEMTGRYYIHYIANAVYGASDENQIPSILHGLSLVIFGMTVGNIAQGWLSGDRALRRAANRMFAILLAASAAATALMWNWRDPGATIADLGLGELRGINHPLYYSSAAVGILLTVALATYLLDVRKVGFAKPVLFAGRTSLFTFSFGNILLFMAPPLAQSLGQAWVCAFVLFGLICFQSWLFDWAKSARADGARGGGAVVGWFQNLLRTMTGAVSGLVGGLAQTYSRVLRLA